MMMLGPKKKIATIIVGRMKEQPGKDGGSGVQKFGDVLREKLKANDEPENDAEVALTSAMEDFLTAVEQKDAKGMASALKDFFYMVDDDGDEEQAEAME